MRAYMAKMGIDTYSLKNTERLEYFIPSPPLYVWKLPPGSMMAGGRS
jgi:hypothetical protein